MPTNRDDHWWQLYMAIVGGMTAGLAGAFDIRDESLRYYASSLSDDDFATCVELADRAREAANAD